jgi:predicted nucleotidyltransferase
MLDRLRRALEAEVDVAYALVFGSAARGPLRPDSDVDVAVELRAGAPREVAALGAFVARLESAAGRPVDLVLLDAAPPPVAYRAFRDGRLLVERDHAALSARKARALLDYLDFKPVEERCAAGVLRAARAGGR